MVGRSKALRLSLAVAEEVRRDEMFTYDATRKRIHPLHGLRATGITWLAVRGDDPLTLDD